MLRKVLAIVGMLLTAPLFILGAKFLYLWARLGRGYAVRFDYGTEAGTWLIWGGLTVLFFLGALQRKTSGALLLLVGWGSLLLFGIALPSHRIDPLEQARFGTAMELRNLQVSLNTWAAREGHVPGSQADLDAAAKEGADSSGETAASQFVHDGDRLPYRLVLVSGARGPLRTPPADAAPGTVFCAVNPELDHYWLTATGLASPVGGAVVMEENPMFLEAGTSVLDGPPPPEKPAEKRP